MLIHLLQNSMHIWYDLLHYTFDLIIAHKYSLQTIMQMISHFKYFCIEI